MADKAVVIVKRFTKIATIEIDSCLEETHTLANTITDHPVESGFNVTDHSRPNPDLVTLKCFVSNTPLSAAQKDRSQRAGDVAPDPDGTLDPFEIKGVEGRGDKAFRDLKKLRDEGTLITVVTTLRTYESSATEGMMIESISIPRTTKNFEGLEFSISLKQIRIVTNKQTADRRPKKKNTQKKEEKGEVVLGPAPRKVTKAKRIKIALFNAVGLDN